MSVPDSSGKGFWWSCTALYSSKGDSTLVAVLTQRARAENEETKSWERKLNNPREGKQSRGGVNQARERKKGKGDNSRWSPAGSDLLWGEIEGRISE